MIPRVDGIHSLDYVDLPDMPLVKQKMFAPNILN